jgi:NDP-sugar pyrophosphorylase family protein
MNGSSLGHLSYCGDSIIGEKVNFGAGTITANLRHDGKNHRSFVDGKLIDTGRRKLGVVVGDNVHTGIHTSLYPGRKIWPNCETRPGEIVQRDIH